MPRIKFDMGELQAFVVTAEKASFRLAAETLCLSAPALSRRVERLELALGVRLLERTTRSVRVTEAGEILFRRTAPLFSGLHDACAEVLGSGREVTGTLRIASPYEFGAHHLAPVACELMLRHPKLQVQIDVENRPINPLTEPYDIVFAMLESQLPSSSVVIRRMFSLERDLFAAPSLVHEQGLPQRPDELRHWPLIASSADAGWSFVDSDGIDHHIAIESPRVTSANADIRMQAAMRGLGVTRITASFCAAAVASGALARVRFAGYTCEPLRVYALLPGKKLQPEKVRHFLDSLAGHARLTREDMGWQFHHDKGTSPA